MNKVISMINALDKCEAITLNDKLIKQAGIKELISAAKELQADFEIDYTPGKGYFEKVQTKKL